MKEKVQAKDKAAAAADKGSLRERVAKALEQVRPALAAHGGDVELVDVSADGTVKVRLLGHCCGCPHARMTLSEGIEVQLKAEVPEVKKVQAVA